MEKNRWLGKWRRRCKKKKIEKNVLKKKINRRKSEKNELI